MKNQEELFYTIKSLSGPEVRFFKIFARRHVIGDENNYVRLFDKIRSQDQHNDGEIRNEFSSEAFVRNLASAKFYLLQLVQRSLCHYHDKEDALSSTLRHIKLSEIYFNKTHYELSEKQLKKAKRLATEHELFELSLMISELRIKNSIASSEEHQLDDVISDEMEYEKEMFTKYLNVREFQNAYIRFKSLEKRIFIPVTQSEKRKYDLILQQSIFNSPNNAISNKAKNIFYELKKSYEDKRYDKIDQQEVNEEMLDFFVQYPKLLGKNASALIKGVELFLKDLLEKGALDKFYSGLAKFRALRTSSPVLNAQIIYKCGALEVDPILLKDHRSDPTESIKQIEVALKDFNDSIRLPLVLSIYHQYSSFLFSKGNFKQALKWNIKIVNEVRIKDSTEISRKASMANLILHYKLSNYDLLENRIQSEKRKLKGRDHARYFEMLIIQALKKLLQSPSTSQKNVLYKQVFSKITSSSKKTTESFFSNDLFFKIALDKDKKSNIFNEQ